MIEKLYIKFQVNPSTLAERKKNLLRKKIITTILFFIPKANPDFDNIIDNVCEWQLEINTKDNSPNREIGVDQNGQVIIIMPWNNNYGYWTDSNIPLDYFKDHFKATEITQTQFDNNWNLFIKQNSLLENYESDKRGYSKYWRFLENHGWTYDGAMTFTKGNNHILFDTSEFFYIEIDNPKTRQEFQFKNIDYFAEIIKNNTTI